MIEDNSLRLRPIDMEDLEILTEWNYDSETGRYLPKKPPLNPDNQEQWLKSQIQSLNKEKYIIEVKPALDPAGLISAMNIDRENGSLEFGITLGNKAYLGKGIAFKASKLFLDFYLDNGFSKILLRVFNDNERAIHLFENLGFRKGNISNENIIGGDEKEHKFLEMHLSI